MVSGCGCKEVYIIISSYYLSLYTPLLSALFSAASLHFVHLKWFSFLFRYFFVIYIMILQRSINTYGRPLEAI